MVSVFPFGVPGIVSQARFAFPDRMLFILPRWQTILNGASAPNTFQD